MSRPRVPTRLGALGAALLVTFLWSSSWILIRWGLDDEALRPVTFAALRYGMAAVILGTWVISRPSLRKDALHIDRRMALELVVLGLVFYAVNQGAQFVAIDNQPAATTSVVLSWTPLLVALLARSSLSEAPTARQVSGASLVVVGAWLYFAGQLGATVAGMTAAVAGLAANVAGALLGRHVNRRPGTRPVIVTTLSMGVGAAALVVAGLTTEGVPTVSLRAWLIIAWLAVVNTAIAFTLWNLSLRRLSALESASVNNTMLVQIAVLAWLFLGERPDRTQVLGILLVSIGVFLAQAAVTRARAEHHQVRERSTATEGRRS